MSDWAEATDPASGRTYYYNATTGETSWEVPEGYVPKSASADPGDWQELSDPTSGKPYYYNAKTGVTQWDKPEGFKSEQDIKEPESSPTTTATTPAATRQVQNENVQPARSPQETVNRQRAAIASRRLTLKKKSNVPQTVEEKLVERAKKFLAQRKQEKAKTQPSAFARLKASELLGKLSETTNTAGAAGASSTSSEWQPVVDPESGKTYYYNPTTNETSWTLPS